MDAPLNKKKMKYLSVGILAHVDAGKTTLSEAILYHTGTIRRLGRVDTRDAFLDTYALERSRGITIFSKQAVFDLGGIRVTLLDTPGHVDFSPEMERTLQVLDCAILVVSGADGVQGHTETLWRLLKRHRIPTFLFVNKMDQPGTDWQAVLADLQKRLDGSCVPFNGLFPAPDPAKPGQNPVLAGIASRAGEAMEELAMCEESVLERFLEDGKVSDGDILRMISARSVFPCYFGSALKLWGVEELLDGLERFGETAAWGDTAAADGAFGARVFKISRDEQGSRLTHLKVTGGVLKVKDALARIDSSDGPAGPAAAEEEKINQIRIYSGSKYELASEAGPGVVCAVTGPVSTYAGQALGAERANGQENPALEPVLTYQVLLPPGSDVHAMLIRLRQLEEEEPMLHIAWKESPGEIQAQVMGQVQIEVLKSLIRERFGVEVEFGTGHIVYKETITAPVEGVGHYEPLRHYAEVHLLMEPAPRGSGLTFGTVCSTDELDLNWQRLILTHLEEKAHAGVLTGARITDMKITLLTGRAHLKHTEGGDFRQATYRAVRHGLMQALTAGSYQLLEPYYRFRLEVPMEAAGRALSDLERMNARFAGPEMDGETAVITGEAPVAAMGNYQMEVASYSKGRGRLNCSMKGYEPCHNTEEVAAAAAYDPEQDLDNPCGSVFCAHGAGFVVDWKDVKRYMHLESPIDLAARRTRAAESGAAHAVVRPDSPAAGETAAGAGISDARGSAAVGGSSAGQGISDARRSAAAGGSSAGQGISSARGSAAAGGSSAGQGISDARRSAAVGGNSTSRGILANHGKGAGAAWGAEDKELEAIFTRTYGEPKRRLPAETAPRRVSFDKKDRKRPSEPPEEDYLLVDGYNIIYAWPELHELAEATIDGARQRLMDIMCNYQGYTGCILILVFDAYKVEGGLGQAIRYHNINVVYTKEAETADQYIEKLAHQMGRSHQVTVATSDGLEQLIIRGQGCRLMSAQDLREAVDAVNEQIRTGHLANAPSRSGNYLLNHADDGLREYLEDVRLGKEGNKDGRETDEK